MEPLLNIYSAVAEFEEKYVQPNSGRTLVAGSHVYPGRTDRRGKFAQAEGWDAIPGEGVDKVVDLEQEQEGEAFDHIECISVLEHTKRPWLVAQNFERLLRSGGTLFLTVPFIWRVHAYPSDYWRFTIEGIKLLFAKMQWEKMMYAHCSLTEDTKARAVKVHEFPYLARTQVCAFGRRA